MPGEHRKSLEESGRACGARAERARLPLESRADPAPAASLKGEVFQEDVPICETAPLASTTEGGHSERRL